VAKSKLKPTENEIVILFALGWDTVQNKYKS